MDSMSKTRQTAGSIAAIIVFLFGQYLIWVYDWWFITTNLATFFAAGLAWKVVGDAAAAQGEAWKKHAAAQGEAWKKHAAARGESWRKHAASDNFPQAVGLIAARVVGWISFVGAICCLLGFLDYKGGVDRAVDGSAVRQNVAEIIATQWLIASGMFGVIWVGLNLTAFLSRALADARDAIVAAIERSSK